MVVLQGGSVMLKDRSTESTDKDVNIVESEKLKAPFFSKEKASQTILITIILLIQKMEKKQK